MSLGDDELEQRLGALLRRADPAPEIVAEAGRAALGWRRLDADLAELLSDSALDAEPVALARGVEAELRSVTYSTGRLTIDLDIAHEGDERVLRGQISPPAELTVEVQAADASTLASVRSDTLGRFTAALPGAATVRLRLSGEQGPIESAWIAI